MSQQVLDCCFWILNAEMIFQTRSKYLVFPGCMLYNKKQLLQVFHAYIKQSIWLLIHLPKSIQKIIPYEHGVFLQPDNHLGGSNT